MNKLATCVFANLPVHMVELHSQINFTCFTVLVGELDTQIDAAANKLRDGFAP